MKPAIGDCTGHPGFMSRIVRVETPCVKGGTHTNNHSSGDPKPGPEDRGLTERLYHAGKLLDIPVLDHIIIGDGTTAYYSFADNGKLSG